MSSQAVLVIGGSSGIGLATALRLSRSGAKVALAARGDESLRRAEQQCLDAGASAVHTVVADVNDAEQVGTAVQQAVERFERLDAVVHTATVMAYGTIADLPPDVFTTVVDTAVHGTFNVARAALDHFRARNGGTLIIVNSLLGSVTVPNMGAYSVAKWGQRALARTLQQEVRADENINVCIVSPGSTNTPIYYQAANVLGKQARPPVPVLQPERAAAAIERLLAHPRKHVSIPVGPANPVVVTGYRLMPFLYDRLVGPLFKLAALTGVDEAANNGNVHRPHDKDDRLFGRWPTRQ